MDSDRLLITANSPGEVAWLKALAREADRRGGTVEVLLLPCTFASGRELQVASALPGVSRVYRTRELPGIVWRGLPGRTRLLHLGGDMMYSALLIRRWGWPAWSYLWTRPWWDRDFRGYFIRNDWNRNWLRKRGVAPEKVHMVGDLVADSVLGQGGELPAWEADRISFLPGSRLTEVEVLTPFYLGVAEKLIARHPQLKFQLLVSPFIDRDKLARALVQPPHPNVVDGCCGYLQGDRVLGPTTSLEVVPGSPQALARSAMIISIPGTKTAEAGVLGVPTLMIMPGNGPEHVPTGGLLGLLDWVPGGRWLKGEVLLRMRDRVGILAQPNLMAGKYLMPEIIGVITTAEVAEEAARLLSDPTALATAREQLQELYRPSRGAAARMLDMMLDA